MKTLMLTCALAVCAGAQAQAQESVELSGDLRLYADHRTLSSRGPLADARRGSSVIAAPDTWTGEADATLTGRWQWLSGSVTLRNINGNTSGNTRRAVLNELAASATLGDMQAAIGKKVVSWDVGYAFRPNDWVQREARRTLVPATLEGRPLAMLEGFAENSAWSLVAWRQTHRTQDANPLSARENALAARYYARIGSADLYAFGHWGSHTHGGVGAAISAVVSDTTELHASVAHTSRFASPVLTAGAPALASSNPYVTAQQNGAQQALIGMTWTTESKFSLIAEAWYDGTAPSQSFWSGWNQRNQTLRDIAVANSAPALTGAAAGNLGWQASLLQTSAARRQNLFVRASWNLGAWQPAVDLLLTPEDRGHAVTASVVWQGERVRLDFGARWFGGPKRSVFGQMPIRSIVYAGMTVPF
jgi:hypothetical protein